MPRPANNAGADMLTPLDAREARLTDVGNAQRFVARHGHDFRFCFPWNRWLTWDGRRWRADDTGAAVAAMKETLAALHADSLEIEDPSARQALVRHVLASEREQRIRGALALAQSEPGAPVLPEELDAQTWLLNVENGTLDLRTLELREHRRSDLLTMLAPVAFDPAADCPRWRSFVDTIFADDAELIAFLARLVGYTLAGTASEQVLLVLYGSGANGKTTFLETLRALFGDYGQQTPADTFLESNGDRIPNDVARLRGARLVAATETGEGRRLNEVLIKRMVGGDTLTARFMRGEWFEFRPRFVPWLATNHRPAVRGTDEAIWRRLRLIPFTVTIPEGERDRDLPAKLREELPGILNWALEGCRAWQQRGLLTPRPVVEATSEYRSESDLLGAFLADCCVQRPHAQASAQELYARFSYWTDASGEAKLTSQAFGRRLSERGFHQTRGHGGKRMWSGVGLAVEER